MNIVTLAKLLERMGFYHPFNKISEELNLIYDQVWRAWQTWPTGESP